MISTVWPVTGLSRMTNRGSCVVIVTMSIMIIDNSTWSIFSSPEHEVLSVRAQLAFVILQCPASVRVSTISLNNISSETAYWILTKLHRNDPWVVPYQSCSNRSSWLHK